MENLIYLDHSATTKMSEEALAEYTAVTREHFGNPSSLHGIGRDAEAILSSARKSIRLALGDSADGTVVFTSGGTEANNLAIFGRANAKPRFRGKTILTTAGEHASVNAPLAALRVAGYTVIEIPSRGGKLDLAALEAAATKDVFLATMMLINNETGALYDLAAVSRILRARCPDAVLHCDATQAFLKVPFSPRALGASLVTVSSHKIEGPKGMGALWIDPALVKSKGVVANLLGGGQENGFRSGTENVPAAAAFGLAAKRGHEEAAARQSRLLALRTHLTERLSADPACREIRVNTAPVFAPHILSLTLPGIRSETMLHALSREGIYVSSGSACSSHGHKGTTALSAFGLSGAEEECTVRVSLSHRNTPEELDRFADVIGSLLASLVRSR